MKDKIISGKPLPPKVTAVEPLDDWKLKLTFEGGEERLFDMKSYRYGVFERLEDPDYFKRVRVSRGCLEWPHLEQALHYDMLYHESQAMAGQ